MVHQYKNNGYNIVMDVCSGAIHVVDDVTYDVIALYEEKNLKEIKKVVKVPVGVISLKDYGLLDGSSIIKYAKQLIQK